MNERRRRRRYDFYATIDEDAKAEFINGAVELHSPATKVHLDAVKGVLKLLDDFANLRNSLVLKNLW